MGKKRRTIKFFLLQSLVFSCLLAFGEPMKISVEEIKGDVYIKKRGTTKYEKIAKIIAAEEGDSIKTESGCATLRWQERYVIKVYEYTIFTIITLNMQRATGKQSSEFYLSRGAMIHKIKGLPTFDSKYTVYTPVAAAGVRGTAMNTTVEADGNTTIEAVEHKVIVTVTDAITGQKKDYEVIEGKRAKIDKSGTIQLKEITIERLRQLQGEVNNIKFESSVPREGVKIEKQIPAGIKEVGAPAIGVGEYKKLEPEAIQKIGVGEQKKFGLLEKEEKIKPKTPQGTKKAMEEEEKKIKQKIESAKKGEAIKMEVEEVSDEEERKVEEAEEKAKAKKKPKVTFDLESKEDKKGEIAFIFAEEEIIRGAILSVVITATPEFITTRMNKIGQLFE